MTSAATVPDAGYWTAEFVQASDPTVIARMLNERWETIFALTQCVAELDLRVRSLEGLPS